MSFGLFRDEEQLRATTELLLAGVPPAVNLAISWRAQANILTFEGVSPPGGVDVWIEREFESLGSSSWTVIHQMFCIPEAYQSGGWAMRMMRSSVEAYDNLHVARIEVYADVEIGGYVWAKIGFAPDDPTNIRDTIAKGLKAHPKGTIFELLARVADTSTDDDLMYNLARAKAPDGTSCGKLLLKGVRWPGHLDLTNKNHRQRLASIF